jgi:hypothetical protein
VITFQDIEQARSRIEDAVHLSPSPSSIPGGLADLRAQIASTGASVK